MNDKNALLIIRGMVESMHAAERRIAEAILDNPESVVNMSVVQLSAVCRVSGGSIVRFCRTVGFDGFSQLKLNIAYCLSRPEPAALPDISRGDGTGAIMSKVLHAHARTLEETAAMLDPAVLERAVDALTRAESICFFGLGTSAPVAMDACHRFLRIGMRASFSAEPHMAFIHASNLGKSGAAVGISHSGRTPEVVEMMELSRRSGAATIAVTSSAASLITKAADTALIAYHSERHAMKADISARLAHVAVLDCLYVCAAMRRYDESLRKMDDLAALLSE